jgi:hypothetical protein
MPLSSTGDRLDYGFKVGCSVLDFRFENGRVQRARAIDSTQVKTADRGLRLQPIVIRIIVQAGVLKAIHDISRLIRCESLRLGKSSHRLHRMDDTPIDRLLQQRRPHEQYHQLPV